MISFDGLERKYTANRLTIISALDDALSTGPRHRSAIVNSFEKAVCPYPDYQSIAVSSGSIGLSIALKTAITIEKSEVITSAFSFAATAGSIIAANATPVFCDVLKDDPFIDFTRVESLITNRTAAILIPHLYGTQRLIDPIIEICRAHKISIIEDAAQLFGAYQTPPIVTPKDYYSAVISFDPYKVVPGLSGGGVILSANQELLRNMRLLKCHGYNPQEQDFILPGFNADMSSVDAAVIMTEIDAYNNNNKKRQEIAYAYHKYIQEKSHWAIVSRTYKTPNNFHKFVIDTRGKRQEVSMHFSSHGIPTKTHYNKPLPDYTAFSIYRGETEYPNAKAYAANVLSLPIYPEMQPHEISQVCNAIRTYKPNG
jgi:dTDP-4-amino-4,6-dideoxygalactose transaminase